MLDLHNTDLTLMAGVEKVFLLSPGDPRQVDLQGNAIEAARRV